MSQAQRILCGVPNEFCSGGILHTDQQLAKKCHTTREEAMKCMGRYLQKSGFEKTSNRTFIDPNSGYIRILPKVSKYGGRLRRGKGEKKTSATRFEPMRGAGLVF